MDEINYVDFTATESIERFIEDQAFSPSYDLSPSPPPQVVSLSQFSCVSMVELTGGGGGRSLIIQRQESLVLYKPFNNISTVRYLPPHIQNMYFSANGMSMPLLSYPDT